MPVKRKPGVQLPEIIAGEWRGELAGNASLRLGQVVQPTEPPQSVEFSQIIASALLTMPDRRFTWPGVLIIAAPTPMKPVSDDAGALLQNGRMPTLCLTLEVTRGQFSDLVGCFERKKVSRFHFAIGDEGEKYWPVTSWGMSCNLPLI